MVPQNNIEITPENSKVSLIRYAMYPVRIVMAIYETPSSFMRNLRFLNTTVVIIPTTNPIKMEHTTTSKNFNIKKGISPP